MTLDLGSLLGILGAIIGIGFFAFTKVRRSTVGARRENEIKVEGQKKVDAINNKAAQERKRVQDELADSRSKDPSDAIGDLIDKGVISK